MDTRGIPETPRRYRPMRAYDAPPVSVNTPWEAYAATQWSNQAMAL
jgi:hypothetical protein